MIGRLFRWHRWRKAPPPAPCDAAAMEKARRAADEHLRRVHERAPEVARVSGDSRRLRAENHFADLIDAALRAHK